MGISRQFKLILISISVTALIVLILVVFRPKKQVVLRAAPMPTVMLTEVRKQDLAPVRKTSGRLRPNNVARLHFEISGPVIERLVEPGQSVEAGDAMMRIDGADYQDAVVKARADLVQEQAGIVRDQTLYDLARQTSKLAKREHARLQKLSKGDLVSESLREQTLQKVIVLKLEEARLKYSLDTAQSRIDEQQSAVDRAQRNAHRAVLHAPYKSRVNRVLYDVGDRAETQQLAVELVDLSALLLYVEVGSDVVAALSLGQPVRVEVRGREIAGKVTALQFDPNQKTLTHPVEIRVLDPALVPGELAVAILPLAQIKNALVAPLTAILQEDGEVYLFVFKEGLLMRRQVSLGARQNSLVQVTGAVVAGETIVARDVASLSQGMAVKAEKP